MSLTEQITDELRCRILNGELGEGMSLRQERLATELGVSRIPLREAIRHLEAEGLVTSELHKGTVVSSLSPRRSRNCSASGCSWRPGSSAPRSRA